MTEPRNNYRSLWLPDLLGLTVLACLSTLPFLSGRLDLVLQSFFHTPAAPNAWATESLPLWRFLYHFGTWPALLTALGGLAVFLAGWRRPAMARFRRHGAFLFLVLAIGPGLLVNTIFKDHWGRPRPRQVAEFGGRWQFQHVLERGAPGRGKSFPCGHSSTGYYFVAFYFLLRRRRPRLALAALAGAMAYGTLIGLARMAAGAHFASDVLWSALFTATAASVLYHFILRIPLHEDHPTDSRPVRRPALVLAVAALMGVGALLATLAATPAYREWQERIPVAAKMAPRLEIDCDRCDVDVSFVPSRERVVELSGEAQGFGWPWSRIRHSFSVPDPGGNTIRLAVLPDAGFSELSGVLRLRIPAGLLANLQADMSGNQITVTAPEGMDLPAMRFRLKQATLNLPPNLKTGLVEEAATNGTTVVHRQADR